MTLTPGPWLGLPAVPAVTLYKHDDPALVSSLSLGGSGERLIAWSLGAKYGKSRNILDAISVTFFIKKNPVLNTSGTVLNTFILFSSFASVCTKNFL